MAIPDEILWDYDAVTAGQAGTATVVELTEENIAMYGEIAQNPDSRYQMSGSEKGASGPLVAMPTMVLTYAPLLRENIAENSGFVALEESTTARRQTPFAKCEIRWHRLAQAGDTITGSRKVLEKYERRGSRFVTFGVSARNQSGQLVSEYHYTCIFEYAKGQRQVPGDESDSPSLASHNAPEPTTEAQRPQPNILTFGDISVGDQLVRLTVAESQKIILMKNDFRLAGKRRASNIHTDEEFAKQNIFGEAVNSGAATMSYVDQMLQLSFPLEAFYAGGSLLMRAITPFRTTDVVTFEGEITEKRPNAPDSPLSKGGVISCRVKGLNQRGDLVCLADATMVMPE